MGLKPATHNYWTTGNTLDAVVSSPTKSSRTNWRSIVNFSSL